MTLLAAPPTWYQFGEATPDHNEACGQNAVASILVALGKIAVSDVSAPLGVDAYLQSRGYVGLSTSGTSTAALCDALSHFGVQPATAQGFAAIDAALSRGHYSIVLVGSDSLGRLTATPSTGHWVVVFGHDADGWHIANSGTGSTQVIADALFRSATPPPSSGSTEVIEALASPPEEPMTAAERQQLSVVLSVLCRAYALGRNSSVDDALATAGRFVNLPMDAALWELTGSPESTQTGGMWGRLDRDEAAIAKLLTAAAAPAPAPAAAVDVTALSAKVDALAASVADLAAHLAAAKEAL